MANSITSRANHGVYKVDCEITEPRRHCDHCCLHDSLPGIAVRIASEKGRVTATELAREAGTFYGNAHAALRYAVRRHRLVKIARGIYALPPASEVSAREARRA